jgi:hypothetical protein
MNLRQNVQELLAKTTSNEVKTVCQKYLKSLDGNGETKLLESSFLADLKQVGSGDTNVAAMLTEMSGYNASIIGMQGQISKAAAQKLASWGGLSDKTVSNVGDLRDNTMLTEAAGNKAAGEQLVESLRTVTSPEAVGVVEAANVADYGVARGIDKIASSKIFSHPSVKYAAARIQNLLETGTPEYSVVREFVSVFGQFAWDADVNEALAFPKKVLADRGSVIEVQEALAAIKQGDRNNFYSEPVRLLNEWLQDGKRNNPTLLRDLKAWSFHPAIKELHNRLAIVENGNGKLSLPVKEANCSVERVYSPVLFEKTGQVFKAGNRFFRSTASKVTSLKEAEVNALPASYHALCEQFFNGSVRVNEGDIIVYMHKSKVRITSDKRVFVNEQRIDAADMGRTLLYHTNANIFGGEAGLIETCKTLLENIDTICEIDYGKKLVSNLYEGLSYVVFKRGGKVYMNAVNEGMGSDKFYEATATQAIKAIKTNLGYDISEAFYDVLEGENKKIVTIKKEMDGVIGNIHILEGEIKKIERAIYDDPYLSEVIEIAEAKVTLETELNSLHSQWQKLTAALKEAEAKPEVETEEEELEAEPEEQEAGTEPEAGAEEEAAEGAESEIAEPEGAEGDVSVEVEVAPEEGGEPAEGEIPAAPVATDPMQQSGLLGAEGTQNAAIAGNDNTTNVVAATDGGSTVDAGFIGAEGAQAQAAQIPGGADILNAPIGDGASALTQTAPPPIEVSGPAVASAPVQGAPAPAVDAPAEAGAEAEGTAEEIEGGEGAEEGKEAGAEEVASDPEEGAETPAEEEGEEKKNDGGVKESIGVGTKVKIKGTDNIGEVQSIKKDEFLVLIDGKTDPFKEDQLEDLDAEGAEKEEDRQKEDDSETPDGDANKQDGDVMSATASVIESDGDGEDTEVQPAQAYVKGKITIDFGEFRKGDSIMVEAEGYAKGGDEDPIKLQQPKGEVTAVPKKYIQIEDVKAEPEKGSIEESLKKIETLIRNSDITVDESVKDAYNKIRSHFSKMIPVSK